MSFLAMPKHFSKMAVVSMLMLSISARALAQQPADSKSPHASLANKSGEVYEDHEIKVTIPEGWHRLPTGKEEPPWRLLLEKNRYTLSLEYHTGQASGIIGGRFIEIFNIAWPGVDDAWTCSASFRQNTWPAGRSLMFVNLIVDTVDPKVREACAIAKPLGTWVQKNGQKQSDFGNRRWFGGYFTTEDAGFFFGDNADGCGMKAYTLTSQAKAAEQLPIADIPIQGNNQELEKIIQEAIDIVDSIQYKRCAPF